jgi:UDP-N-acetylglucosamine--N-acetylmuramyl-(pentapeptide) pyrophosphoryl-undecaprenol N-acetylglucosamine transferase
MPIRREFWETQRAQARKELGLGEEPLVVSTFGSQGARVMNEMTARLFALEQQAGFPFHHIHAVGKFGADWMPQMVKENGVNLEACPTINMREHIYNMLTVLAAADVVLGRAGSGTCNEIAATGTPCILIPSPNVTNNHQEKNARILESRGGAVVVTEPECTAQEIFEQITSLMADQPRRKKMSEALRSMVILDSAERICDIVEELINRG